MQTRVGAVACKKIENLSQPMLTRVFFKLRHTRHGVWWCLKSPTTPLLISLVWANTRKIKYEHHQSFATGGFPHKVSVMRITFYASCHHMDMLWMGAYHVKMDVIHRTRYGFSYYVQANSHIERCKSVDRTSLMSFKRCVYWNLIHQRYLTIKCYNLKKITTNKCYISKCWLMIHPRKDRWAAKVADASELWVGSHNYNDVLERIICRLFVMLIMSEINKNTFN